MILSAGMSPAWQQILTFDTFAPGEVNRASEAHWCASGKVLNVGQAVWSLGGKAHTLSTVGGTTGEAIRDEFTADRIPATWVVTSTPTRVCTTIIDRSPAEGPQITELVENAGPVTSAEVDSFESAYRRLVSSARFVVLTGSLPPLVSGERLDDFYARLLKDAPPALLDVRGPELWAALPLRPLVVKPNRAELAATVDSDLKNESAVIKAMHKLIDAGAQHVLVTHGTGDVLLSDGRQQHRFTFKTADTINPIGCGDCLAAGIAVAIRDGAEMPDAVHFGLSAAAENARQLRPAILSSGPRELDDICMSLC